jgi:hypothetical protein
MTTMSVAKILEQLACHFQARGLHNTASSVSHLRSNKLVTQDHVVKHPAL